MLDVPNGTYWTHWREFVVDELAERELIAPSDVDLFLVTDDVEAACDEIVGFYSNYDSMRYVGDRLVIRLTGPAITLAGGTVTDPDPPRVRRAAPKRAPEPARLPPPEPPSAAAEELYARLAATPLTPPAVGAGDERPLAHLVAAGRAVRAGRDLAFTAEAVATAQRAVVELAGDGGRVTLAQLRDRLGISRKFAQGLLEALDARGVTRRVGDERILRRRAHEP